MKKHGYLMRVFGMINFWGTDLRIPAQLARPPHLPDQCFSRLGMSGGLGWRAGLALMADAVITDTIYSLKIRKFAFFLNPCLSVSNLYSKNTDIIQSCS